VTAKTWSAQTLRLDRTRFRPARLAKLVPFQAWLERNIEHRQPSTKRTALAQPMRCPSLRLLREQALAVTLAGGGKGLQTDAGSRILDKNGFVPPKGKGWVDYIRTSGNEANHEIVLMSEGEAIALISLSKCCFVLCMNFLT